jgi:hypothetical protein
VTRKQTRKQAPKRTSPGARKHAGRRRPVTDKSLKMINFRADRTILDAIELLTLDAVATGVMAGGGAQSTAIRRAILEAVARRRDAGDGEVKS